MLHIIFLCHFTDKVTDKVTDKDNNMSINNIMEFIKKCISKIGLSGLSTIELSVLAIFALFIVLPFHISQNIAFYIDSPFSVVAMFAVTVYLFFNTHPILGVLFIIVSYELLRRSAQETDRVPIIEYVPSQNVKDAEMIMMNPPKMVTLEEEMVALRSPVDISRPVFYEPSTFKPVYDKVVGASSI